MDITVLRFETLASTNDEAANQARQGAAEGLCVIAREQTAGRGRQGRSWVSNADTGLYFSIVLRPKIGREQLGLITLMAGVAVHDTLTEFGLTPDVKWVNDVLVNDKKISGILAEAVETPTGLAVILGVGINVDGSPAIDAATSIEKESCTALSVDEVAERLTDKLSYYYDRMNGDNGPAEIVNEWSRRSSYFRGKPVRVTLPDGVIEGVTDGLEANGALRVKLADGSVSIVQAGDVERLREKRQPRMHE